MIPLVDLLLVAGIVAGLAALIGGGGLVLLRALRGRSVAIMLAVVAAVTVASTLAGVAATGALMFITLHDRRLVLILVIAGGLAGLAVALLLGRWVIIGSRSLRDAVRSVADGQRFTSPEGYLPAELAEISRELETAHLRLEEARTRERALETSRRELVAWVSHDLRTPLAGLRAMAEALEDGVAEETGSVAHYHAQIRREVDRLAEMVDDLFELARIHSGALRLSRQRMGLGDLVTEALASADPLAKAKGVRLSGAADREIPVDVDAEELGRALRNLVVNAIRHTPDDGAVEILGSMSDGVALLTVSDGCGGIPDHDLPRVFEAAFRGEPARTPGPEQGAGFGLAIARGIVEAHAGEIDVANAGMGCRFVVRLPLPA